MCQQHSHAHCTYQISHLILTLMVLGKNAHIFITHSPPGNTTITRVNYYKYSIWWECSVDVHMCTSYCVCMVLVYSVMTCCSLAPSAPLLVTISGSSTVGFTQTLNLTCRVLGIANRFLWYHDGLIRLSSTDRYYSKSTQPRDSGIYQCRACNWAGCTSYSNSLIVTVRG